MLAPPHWKIKIDGQNTNPRWSINFDSKLFFLAQSFLSCRLYPEAVPTSVKQDCRCDKDKHDRTLFGGVLDRRQCTSDLAVAWKVITRRG